MAPVGTSKRIPLMPLEGVGGPGAWWQRKEMLIALLHRGCDPCRRFEGALTEAVAEDPNRELGVALLPIGECQPDGTPGRQLEVARDAVALTRALQSALGLEPGSAYVVVADRFADVARVRPVHDAPERVAREALDAVDAVELQCPE